MFLWDFFHKKNIKLQLDIQKQSILISHCLG